ncbi:membrane cofactor protein-like [Sorex fumeus]|uniref:membrane cofactor protein-like n=1 Tax=Sorex fumeus TaxID=62283 RepID=UPI0024ACAE40|nr:membrane cofactor protein-like [Sorex fumeus]
MDLFRSAVESFCFSIQALLSKRSNLEDSFRLIGPEVLYCDVVGNTVDWSDAPPLCEKILCRPPEKIPNGKYSSSHKEFFEYGEVVTYTCNPSAGPDKYSLIGTNRRICSGDGDWTGTPPRCKVVKCPYPVVTNGLPRSIIPNKSYYNTTVLFDCLPGFVLQGSDIVRCDADSRWKPELPTCVPDSEPTVTTPTQASRDPSSVNHYCTYVVKNCMSDALYLL